VENLKTHSVPGVERAVSILEILANSKRGLSLAQVSRELKLPKSSAHCLLLTLERLGYLRRSDETHRYTFGLKLFALANITLMRIDLRAQAAPLLSALMQKLRMTLHLAILERGEAVLIEKLEPPNLHKLATWIGKRMDVHCTGVGKALIAHLPQEELDHLVRERGLPRHNENTIVSIQKLGEQLAQVRRIGYALDNEEDEIGLRCVACPVLDQNGKPIAAISVAGTTSQITGDNLTLLADELKRAASHISAGLA
jgi:DNA-binding IclR family transcriptional regulator